MENDDCQQWESDVGSGYSQMRPLGEGGMGTLYLAHKDSLDIDVVIKRVKQKFHGRMDERAEANILKNLKHKYLPRIYDIIQSPGGYIYTVMDYIQGENMQKYIKNHGPANQKMLYSWACQLCEAVAYLHDQNPPILHCDIKPSNIMVTPTGDLCVIDFNTSLVFSKGALALGATAGYAAPEQYTRPTESNCEETLPIAKTIPVSGQTDAGRDSESLGSSSGANYSATAAQATNAGEYGAISKRTDVYGIGATLYFAATGQRPAHSLQEVRPITSYKCGLSRSFQTILIRAMQKHQEDRFQDAQEMLRALRDIHTMDRRYQRIVRGQKAVAGIALLLSVAGTASIGMGLQRIGQERRMLYDSLVRSGRTLGQSMQFEEAEKNLDRAVTLYDDRLEAYVEQIVLLYRRGKYQECVDEIGSILTRPLQYESKQAVSNLYYTAARSYDALEEYENAVQMYQKALEYTPDQAIHYQGLVAAQIQLGNLTGAEETLASLVENIPDAPHTAAYQVALGTIKYQQGDLDGALEVVKSACVADGDPEQCAQAYLLADRIYQEMGNSSLSDEIALLTEGVESLPVIYSNLLSQPLASAYLRRADADTNTKDLAQALELYQKMQENGNDTFEVRLSTAIVQYRMKEFEDAEKTLLALEGDYPDDYRIYKWLAFVADAEQTQKGGDYANAQAYWLKAKQLYEIVRVQGTSDPEMTELEDLAAEWS